VPKPDVTVPASPPPTDLVIEDLVVGDGDEARPGDQVNVHYVGVAWSTGAQFDASWDRGEPFVFGLGEGQVIAGWGSRRRGYAPRWPPASEHPAPLGLRQWRRGRRDQGRGDVGFRGRLPRYHLRTPSAPQAVMATCASAQFRLPRPDQVVASVGTAGTSCGEVRVLVRAHLPISITRPIPSTRTHHNVDQSSL